MTTIRRFLNRAVRTMPMPLWCEGILLALQAMREMNASNADQS